MTRVAVLGLGEAGGVFARALGHRVEVVGWDPAPAAQSSGLRTASTAIEAVKGAQAVLAFTSAKHAPDALHAALLGAAPSTLYADFATAGPALKRELASMAADAGLRFADAAIMAPVTRGASDVPVVVSGDGANELAGILAGAGIPVETIPGGAGAAAARKLLRSLLVKGLTGVMIESQRAAEREGLDEWFAEHLVETLTTLDRASLVRLLDGTRVHAVRRVDEVEAAARMAEQAGGRAPIALAVAETLRSVATEGVPGALS